MEIWKPITELGIEVSDHGNVLNSGTCKWLRPYMIPKGYLRVQVRGKHCLIHRLVMLAFNGPCPEGKEVNHINLVKTDNRLANLEYVTPSQNILHAVKAKRMLVEQRIKNAKLTKLDVRQIRRDYSEKSQNVIQMSRRYGISVTAIYDIIKNRTWKNVA